MASFAPSMKPRSRLRPLSATLASALAAIMIPGCATMEPAGGANASSAAPAKTTIRGSIVYRNKIVLPDDAQLVVSLVDVSRVDKPAMVATTTIPTAGRQVPLPFTLAFDPADAKGTHHALRASIRYGGKTQFVTGSRVSIDPLAPPQGLTMMLVPGEAEVELADSPMPRTGPNRGGPPVGAGTTRGAPPRTR